MRDVLAPGTLIGYCTNVHAGADLAQTLANLERYTLRVKARVSPDAPMGVGLWLSARSARELIEQQRVGDFAAWLSERCLTPFTLNGFPHGDFHQPVVKHAVYRPQWDDPARLDYTKDLTAILVQLLGEEREGSISTLPIGWRAAVTAEAGAMARAADHLVQMAEHLAQVEAQTGKLIHVDIEPEPGCYLDTSADVVALFEQWLLPRGREDCIRRHLRVCHDVCHAAVMFEDQRAVLQRYRQAGIAIGKVQVSSAVRARFDAMASDDDRLAALAQLRAFHEPRYLHQTVVRDEFGEMFYEDLFDALARADATSGVPRGEWRTHFHVPLFVDKFGKLESTQDETIACLQHIARESDCTHFEAETYAWNVLPPELQTDDLADGIARELLWLREQAAALERTR